MPVKRKISHKRKNSNTVAIKSNRFTRFQLDINNLVDEVAHTKFIVANKIDATSIAINTCKG